MIALASSILLGAGSPVRFDFDEARADTLGQLEDPIPQPIRKGFLPIGLKTVATGLTAPNGGTNAPGHPFRLFVSDQVGIIWDINLITGSKSVFLDVSDRLVNLGLYDERGLLGVAFHPNYASNGLLYTYTSEPVNGLPDFSTMPDGATADHQSLIIEWRVTDPANPRSAADSTSVRELLRIDQPGAHHNGGALNFGPDGMLYISLGDGGSADDQGIGHGDKGNGQDPSNVLGAILRIDPLGSNSANGQYGIPPDNPFVGQSGFVDEIFAYGFRNPFRFSFDKIKGTMFIADVGQNDIEEVDIGYAGGNYGWNHKEGAFFFDDNGNGPGFVTDEDPGGLPSGLIDPIAQYDHDEGIAVIGGFVYRGSRIPFLRGRYVFGDFLAEEGGRLFHMSGNRLPIPRRVAELRIVGREGLGMPLLGFGQDAGGELYVLANENGTPKGKTGVVMRIVHPLVAILNPDEMGVEKR
ncbi:MAG: PQQ-dependent sugar dehydrogenase [Chloroflexi bacterium]|nr:PQQ-dependent sugar dehydrogenase [Chloroflexota bacterium]